MEGTKKQISRTLSGPPHIKSHRVPAPPDKGAKRPRLFACSRIEFQKKADEYERKLALHQKYTSKGMTGPQRENVQFVTKVQIRTTKTPVPSTSICNGRPYDDVDCKNYDTDDNDGHIKETFNSIEKDDVSSRLFSHRVPRKNDSIDLLWSENSLESVEDDNTEVMRLVRTLSRRLDQNRLLYQRTRQDRPTASFAAPTKGEINLLMKSPDFKKNIKTDRCHGHKILLLNRGRALSLPVSNYSTTVNSRPFRLPPDTRPLTGRVNVQLQEH